MRSIQLRLLLLILGICSLIWIGTTCFLWWRSHHAIHQVFDAELVKVAQLIGAVAHHEQTEKIYADPAISFEGGSTEFPLIFQAWSYEGKILLSSPAVSDFPFLPVASDGFSNKSLRDQRWRVYTLSQPAQHLRVHVAQERALRDNLILGFVLNILQPMVLLIPLIGLLWLAIRKGLTPLHFMAEQISNRDHSNLEPLPVDHAPAEVVVMVNEINALFERLKSAIEREKRFTSNAAHELRTPITSTITHAHAALNSTSQQEREHSLSQLIKGSKQLSHIVEQLLTLARLHPDQLRHHFTSINLRTIAEQVLSELSPFALEKNLDIELRGEGRFSIEGNEELSAILLRNLINNAIQATPPGGQISVNLSHSPDGACIKVEDTGPGIPESERHRVFERFTRLTETTTPGAGLGLSIVRSIIELYSGQLYLSSREATGSGLVVTLQFPQPQKIA